MDSLDRQESAARPASLLPALLLLALSLLTLPLLSLRSPAAGQEVALLFPPGTTAAESLRAVAAAEGLAVRSGGFDNLMVARFPRDLGWSSVWELGALAALDPAVAGACAALLQNPPESPPEGA